MLCQHKLDDQSQLSFCSGAMSPVFLQLPWQPPKTREQSGIIAPIMDCPEKEALQTKCSAAWEAYEAEAKRRRKNDFTDSIESYSSIEEVFCQG